MNMTTPVPFSFNPRIPVTPSPDHQTFGKTPLSPQLLQTFTQEVYGVMGGKLHPATIPPAARSVPLTTNLKPGAISSIPAPIPVLHPGAPNSNHANINTSPSISSAGTPSSPTSPAAEQHPMDLANDPRYLAMASRIASYYQQRCQAVANYQQQRCQQWANLHRQKCQEMMQAAMLVVAWYIRDRISRKRKRAKRCFKRGLVEKRYASDRPKAAKGDAVRRWVMEVPSLKGGDHNEENKTPSKSPTRNNDPDILPPHDSFLDPEEAEFSMDKEQTPKKDTKLFNVADNLIKSQLAKIDVPLLGALSFDESESESEDEDEDMPTYRDYFDQDERDIGENDDEMVDDEEGYYDDEDEYDEEYDDGCEEDTGEGFDSEKVHVGTGQGSHKRTRSSVS